MSSVFQCKNFKWTIHGQVFETDVMILPLGGYEMVLGIQWLATLGVIQFDFKNLVMDFMINEKRCVLRGTPQSTLQWMQGKHVTSSLNQMGVEISNMVLCGLSGLVKVPFLHPLSWECDVCQRSKADLAAYLGLLQPLPIPDRIWGDISMDFIVGLSRSQEKSVIFVVVDRLIYKLHRLPDFIVSDRDSVFLSHFWQSLLKILKVELKVLTAYHPQTDGQTEVVNKCLECYLRCMTGERPKEWDRMKKYADLKRSEREFDVGIWVYVKLQPHRQVTIRQTTQNKLSPKYYGPFLIVAKVGLVAYKLDLPSGSQVHPVFHVSQLKLCKGNSFKKGLLPHYGEEGLLSVEPEKILDRRIGKVNNRAAVYVLVKWINHSEEDATWELAEDLSKRFPEISLDP
nr:integrase, catalytic core [Tanacetum cinerariifolium]